jgi:ATP-dependent Lhr-like helicase
MGAIDLVVQVEAPPSVASGLQRIGRAGHQVGEASRGKIFPKYRGDLLEAAVVVPRMEAGQIEETRIPRTPLDVLAQQIVAICSQDVWTVDGLHALVTRAENYRELSREQLEGVLDMLSGRYPSDEFAELKPRLVWDRTAGTLQSRNDARVVAVTSGGTIPDRGLYGVFLPDGTRVGELDEEMVYESRPGETFLLGASTWRIEDITHDRVLVTPAPGLPGRLPFWKGDQQGRPAELGRAVGAFVREVVGLSPDKARARVTAAGLDEWAADNLLGYLAEQKEATRHVPDDRTIVVERFRDEIGDWRVAVHSPFGGQVHAPWALCVSARMRERYGVDVQAMHGDDGIVFRLPDLEFEDDGGSGRGVGAELLELVRLDADDVHDLVTSEIGGSALFAARFRECASRALLLPRRRPDRRQPLWQQRQRAAQLLEVASQYASFPIVLETVRECVQDVFDVPGLTALMRSIESREVTLVDVESAQPSPFARSLMFGYVAQFLYEGDSPLAEKRAAALALDPTLLAELLGRGEGLSLRDLLDPAEVTRTESELQRLVPERACRDGEDIADLLRVLGPIPLDAIQARSRDDLTHQEIGGWLVELEGARRVIRVRVAGQERWAAIEDAGRLRDALGCSLPVGIPQTFLESVPDPLGDLVRRYARTHGPFPAAAVAAWWGVGPAVALDALRRLVSSGRVVEGELLPTENGGGIHGLDYCDAEVLRLLRRRSLAALRAEVEPVPAVELARFLPQWQSVGGGLRGREGLVRAIEQLAGAVLPASALETLVLPSRVVDYSPALLDDLTSSGEVLWRGHGSLPGDDGWVSLHLADTAHLTLAPLTDRTLGESEQAVVEALAGGGAYFFRTLADAVGSTDDEQLLTDLWALAWDGRVSNDTLTPLRALLAGGRTAHKRSRQGPRTTRYAGRRGSLGTLSGQRGLGRPPVPTRSGPAAGAGRGSLLPEVEPDATIRAYATAEVLLDRYGVVTRGSVVAEEVPGGFAGVYRVLAAAEESGRVRRGYFVESLGASQFSTTGAVDRLRAGARAVGDEADRSVPAMVLAATDPANPYGAALPGPDRAVGPQDPDGSPALTGPSTVAHGTVGHGTVGQGAVGQGTVGKDSAGKRGHQPARKAGALVVLVDGELVLYVERGGKTLLSWTDDGQSLQGAADALALAVREGALGRLTVEKADGGAVLGSDHPLAAALAKAGFHATPRGLRLRR